MPTTMTEAQAIRRIFDEYIDEETARKITERLDDEVGSRTDNDSLKVSLQMLRALYARR